MLVALGCVVVAVSSAAQGRGATSRVGWAGVTVNLPAGWHAMQLAVPAGVTIDVDPVARIAAASGPISFGNGCGEFPYSFPDTAVALVVLEWTRPTPGAFPHRPAQFTSKTLPVHRPPAVECFNGPAGSTEFTEHGRRFDAFLLLGRHAPSALADQARAVLDTLSVVSRKNLVVPHACSTPQLRIRLIRGGAALGNVGGYIGFTNESKTPCRMSGWPTLAGVTATGASTTARHVRATMFGPDPRMKGVPVVILRRGERADAVFAGSDNSGPGETRCPPSYRRLRVSPPGGSRSVLLSAWLPGLAAYMPSCAGIQVTMVVPSAVLYRG
jgi:hypothetical protein